jgi:hypothetical protein
MKRITRGALTALVLVLAGPCLCGQSSGDDAAAPGLEAFSDPARIWGNGPERVIEEAYRLCFKTRILGGKIMTLRMPFAQNNERDKLTEEEWGFMLGGKGDPVILWEKINTLLDSEDFRAYTEALSDGKEKVVIFNIVSQTWRVSRNLYDIAGMKSGTYQGLPHEPYVLVKGKGLEESDVYNYLFCVGRAGMDCSGFVWHVLSHLAKSAGVNLAVTLRSVLGVENDGLASFYAGTSFYASKNPQIEQVNDSIDALRPADILLFRGKDGGMAHSAIIQSVDFQKGVIRYFQSTDEAPLAERGVHESFIRFDPSRPALSLKDPSLVWTQERYPAFPGEQVSPFSNDGERYRAYPLLGGGKVVRIKALRPH